MSVDGTILNKDIITEIVEQTIVDRFELQSYLKIMELIKSPTFRADDDFRKAFNRFYKIRQKPQIWYDRYYELLEEQRHSKRTYKELLELMYEANNSIEVSFISKLIATYEPDKPIWDKYVLINLGMSANWERARAFPRDTRIEIAIKIYSIIKQWYTEFIPSSQGQACIAEFDRLLPHYKTQLTPVKKIDYLLWSKR